MAVEGKLNSFSLGNPTCKARAFAFPKSSICDVMQGGYCMTMLYGVLPPAMAWAMHRSEERDDTQKGSLSRAKPALVGVGLFACGIVMEQVLQDLLAFIHQ